MKSIIRKFLCISAAACCIMTGCSAKSIRPENGKLSVVTTCFPPYDFARTVFGDTAEVSMLLCPGAEAHSYEPAPLDILKIQECDVFVYVGGEGEVWADELLGSLDTSSMTIIRLFDYADTLPEAEVAGASPNGHEHHHHHDGDEHEHEDEHEDEHEHDEYSDEEADEADEHIWTSLSNARKCLRGMSSSLGEVYPQSADFYSDNAETACKQLAALDLQFADMISNAPNDLIVIGDRFPFRYLTADYGIDYFAAFSGCSSESEPGVYTMAFLIDEILEHDLDTVFYLEFSTKKLAEKLCDATGADMLPLHSCHNVSASDFENGVTYLDLMWQNYNNLREALY